MGVDKKTRDMWMAQFAIYAASDGYDVVCIVSQDGVKYFSDKTHELWCSYRMGRLHQSASVSLLTVPVVKATNWHDINVVARGGG